MPYKDPEQRREHNQQYRKEWAAQPSVRARLQELARRWAAANRIKRRAAVKAYRQRHPDRVKVYKQRYDREHAAENLAAQRARNSRKKEKLQAQERARTVRRRSDPVAQANRRRQQREYYERNKLQRIEAVKKYQAAHAEEQRPLKRVRAARRRSRVQTNGGTFTRQQWLARLAYYGHRCAYCRAPVTERSAHIDHIIPIAHGGTSWPANLAPACQKCNLSKGTKRLRPSGQESPRLTMKES